MFVASHGKWCGAFFGCLMLACSAEPLEQADVGELQQPLEITNAKGAVFRLVGKARGEARDPAAGPPGSALAAGRSEDAELPSDPLVLAEALRGVMLRDGYEYREVTAPVALAERIIAARKNKASFGTPSNPGAGSTVPEAPEREARTVFGSDNRVYRSDNTAFPYRTLVWGDQGCSGFMIGPGTMLTAAHCVYFTTQNAWVMVQVGGVGVPLRWPAYAPGVDARDASPSPYGFQQCYDVTVPNAFINEPNEVTATAYLYDYAVIDFTSRCGVRPGDATGWLGTWIYSEASLESFLTRIYGYPLTAGGAGRVKGSRANYTYVAEIWGTTGGVFIDATTTAIQTPTIDTSLGQSGSPWFVIDGGQHRAVGIHTGGGAAANWARRWDGTVFNFVDAYSQYPQQQ